jgi:predicted negative regulator of RcsB-dependent stress response
MQQQSQESEEHAGVNPTPVHIGGESLLDRLVPHIKKILVVTLAAVAVIAVVVTWRWWKQRGEGKTTAALVSALAVQAEEVEGASFAVTTEPSTAAPASKHATHAARATALLQKLEASGGAEAAGALYHAHRLADAGKLDAAEAEFKKHVGRAGLEGTLAREGLGYVLEAKAQAGKDASEKQRGFEKALEAFRTMQPSDTGERRDYALYHEGRILTLLGKTAEAVAAFEKALQVVPESELKGLIEARIAALETAK